MRGADTAGSVVADRRRRRGPRRLDRTRVQPGVCATAGKGTSHEGTIREYAVPPGQWAHGGRSFSLDSRSRGKSLGGAQSTLSQYTVSPCAERGIAGMRSMGRVPRRRSRIRRRVDRRPGETTLSGHPRAPRRDHAPTRLSRASISFD